MSTTTTTVSESRTSTGETDELSAAIDAIEKGRSKILAAATRWEQVARTLTELRQYHPGPLWTPRSAEEWNEERPLPVPFDWDEFGRQLARLDQVITKAWTLVAVCRDEAVRLDNLLEDVAETIAADAAGFGGAR